MRNGAARTIAAALACLGVFVALSAIFAPTLDAGTHRLAWTPLPGVEAALALAALALLARLRRRLGVGAALLALTLALVAALNLASVLVGEALSRPLDLWWDLPHAANVYGLFAEAAGGTRAALALAGAALGTLLAVAVLALALRLVAGLLAARPHLARATLALALLVGGAAAFAPPLVAAHGIASVAEQGRLLYRVAEVALGADNRYSAALRAPAPPASDLALLGGRDVHLVFFESYGSVVFDDPRYRARLAPAFRGFAAAAERAGFATVSRRLVSPTFGGGSWLAHATVGGGIRVDDQLLYHLLLRSHRPTLPGILARAGYRTVEIVPGIKTRSPETAFWGFDASYDAAALHYQGPPFGWFTIPDQFTLATAATRELAGAQPVFAQWVLVSSHTPFAPVPPYLADWSRAATYAGVAEAEWRRIYAEPDWQHLEGAYLDSVAYDLAVLGDWLGRLRRDAIVVILGDHQPPRFITGATSDWSVPVHILARDPALLDQFRDAGYRPGLDGGEGEAPRGMESFLGDLLNAVDSRGGADPRPSATGS